MTHDGEKIAIWERGDGENLPMARRARAREPRIDGLICPAPRPPWIISAPPPRTHVSRCAFRARSRRGPVRGGARVPSSLRGAPVASGRSVAPLPRALRRRGGSRPRRGPAMAAPSRGLPRGLRVDLDADVVRGLRVRGSRRGEFSAWAREHPRVGHRGAPADLRQLQERQVRGGILRVRRDVAHRGLLQPPGVRGEPDAPDTAVHGAPVHRHDDRPHRAARLLQRETRRILGRPNPQEPPRRRPRGPRGASAGRLPPGVAGVPSRRGGEEERGDDAATPEGGESESRDASDAEDSSDDEERRRPRVRRDSGAFRASRPSRRKPRRSWRREEKPPQKPPDVPRRAASPSAAPPAATAPRATPSRRPPNPPPLGPGVGRAARRRATGTEAARTPPEEDPEASSARPFPPAAGSPRGSRARVLPGARARRRGPRRAPRGRSSRERRRAGSRGRPDPAAAPSTPRGGFAWRGSTSAGTRRRRGRAARRFRSGRSPETPARGGEGRRGERGGLTRGTRGTRVVRRRGAGGGAGVIPRRRRGGGDDGVRRRRGVRRAPLREGGNFFHSPARVGVRRALLSAAAGYNHKPLIGSAPSWLGPALGWAMTGIYLGGRVPQIVLNHRRGSVEGLSISMFALAVLGNATYMASILARSCAWWRIKPNLPWLTARRRVFAHGRGHTEPVLEVQGRGEGGERANGCRDDATRIERA